MAEIERHESYTPHFRAGWMCMYEHWNPDFIVSKQFPKPWDVNRMLDVWEFQAGVTGFQHHLWKARREWLI